jgi:REP element-mobilizing transposase RayT
MSIFRDDFDRAIFLYRLDTAVERHRWRCHAYCLMGNHFHAILETELATLADGMQLLCGAYAQGFNRRHGRSGHVFQGRYDTRLIETERHLLESCRYNVLNPVRAGICESAGEWPWSSYLATAQLQPVPAFLTTDWLLRQFGTDPRVAADEYRRFVAAGVGVRPLLAAVGI